MNGNANWYTSIAEKDRIVVDATAKWLRPVPWQWFITLTFPWNVRSETADAKLKQWLNLIEQKLRTRVCFVAGKERKPRVHGMEVPWHFHLLVTSMVDLPKGLLEDTWRKLLSRPGRHRQDGHFADVRLTGDEDNISIDNLKSQGRKYDKVLVESYDHNRLGPEYCLKSISSCDGDWYFRWLELFNPRIKLTSCPSHRKIRARTRFAAEQSRISRSSITFPGITSALPRVGRHG